MRKPRYDYLSTFPKVTEQHMAKPGLEPRDFISTVCKMKSAKEQSVVKHNIVVAQAHGICRRKWSRYCRLSGNQEQWEG